MIGHSFLGYSNLPQVLTTVFAVLKKVLSIPFRKNSEKKQVLKIRIQTKKITIKINKSLYYKSNK